MTERKAKLWVILYLFLTAALLFGVGGLVVKVDPFFHYHKPLTQKYYYPLTNQRSQNNGIARHFYFDAMITGTSMIGNSKTSEVDRVFDTTSVKAPFPGGRYKEINDNVETALRNHPNLRMVIRCLDMSMFFEDKDSRRDDLGNYPTYLYDDNIFNDVRYVFNRDVLFQRVYPLVRNARQGQEPGLGSFDDFSAWMGDKSFGVHSVCPEGFEAFIPGEAVHMTEEERSTILDSIAQNITSLPERYPETTFYYFFSPYSAAWWGELAADGTIYRQIEAEQLLIEKMLAYDNIHLFSFNMLTDITTDLNNYKDTLHYGSWVNTLMLYYMKDERCLLTEDNYRDYLEQELTFYENYDYDQLNRQADFAEDAAAEDLLRREVNGYAALEITESEQ